MMERTEKVGVHRKMRDGFLWLFLCLGSTFIGRAQSDMNYFVGSWDFEIVFEGNTTEKPDISAKWFVEKGLDSAFCLLGHVELNGATYTREMMSYDRGTKQYTRSIATNDGLWLVFTTKGWEGDQLVWTGTSRQGEIVLQMKEEITRVSPTTFTARFYNWEADKWNLTQTETLKRQKRQHHE